MGNICHSDQPISQSNLAGSRLRHPKTIKNMPRSSYAYQVIQPQLNRNVQATLNDPKFHTSKVIDVEHKPFFYIISKKAYYQGDFNQNRLPHGHGIAIFSDGTYYQGEFIDGQAYDDQGIIIFPNGAYYQGQIRNNTMHGRGKITHRNVYSYDGEWQNGCPNGNGVETYYKDNVKFDGSFVNGQKNGNGQYVWDHGASKYIGNFSQGLMNDKNGVIQAQGGINYEGQFVRGKRQGLGSIRTSNGILSGYFRNDQINGQGRFQWNDGKIYQGNFRKSQFHGPGRIIYPNKSVVQGEWSNNHNKSVVRIPS